MSASVIFGRNIEETGQISEARCISFDGDIEVLRYRVSRGN